MNIPDNIEQLRLDGTAALASKRSSKRPPRARKGEPFIAGPLPLPWITAAAALPGKALHVAMAIWFLVGVQKNNSVKLTSREMLKYSVLPDAKRRALTALEDAGLIRVDRGCGRSPIVTILTPGRDENRTD